MRSKCVFPDTNVSSDTLRRCSRLAFYRCGALRSVTIPDSVLSIGFSAFEGCTQLSTFTISNDAVFDNSAFVSGACDVSVYAAGAQICNCGTCSPTAAPTAPTATPTTPPTAVPTKTPTIAPTTKEPTPIIIVKAAQSDPSCDTACVASIVVALVGVSATIITAIPICGRWRRRRQMKAAGLCVFRYTSSQTQKVWCEKDVAPGANFCADHLCKSCKKRSVLDAGHEFCPKCSEVAEIDQPTI